MAPRNKPARGSAVEPPRDANLVLSKQACPFCPSTDAFAVYDDGHGFCFSEGKLYSRKQLEGAGYDMAGVESRRPQIVDAGISPEIEQFIATAKPHPITSRKLTLATTKRWNYLARRNPHKHTVEHLALYRDKAGRVVAVKIRTEEPKNFRWEGKPEGIALYGQHMWGSGGKYLTITEGEIDALTVSQCFDHRYPVVSVPGGAAGAAKAITSNLEWVNSFDKVVLMFDQDEPGQEAARECAALIAPGKAFIAFLPEKDPNECLVQDKAEDIVQAFWNAKKFTMAGVVDARTLSIRCKQKIAAGRPWPWRFLTQWTFGRRPGEVIAWGSGTGMGKSDLLAEIVASTILGKTKEGVLYQPTPVGLFNFEAVDYQIKLLVANKLASRRFHIPNMPEFGFDAAWTEEERDRTLDMMDNQIWDNGGRLYVNEQGFKAYWPEIVSRMRYLNKAEGVHEFVVDPLGAIVADTSEEDERRFLDELVREAADLSLELESLIHLVSHLTRPAFGPSHEEGGQVRLNQFRGSNGIGMFTSYAFGMERNQQAEDPKERLRVQLRSVKDRKTGLSTGLTHSLYYDTICGTLDEENIGAGTAV